MHMSMSARDKNGGHLFTSAEFLTSQQISDFFSLQAAKRTLKDDVDKVDDFNEESKSRENHLSNQRKHYQ